MTDTHLPGSASALRAAAAYLREGLAAGATRVADESVRQRQHLHDAWQGQAGAAFRQRAGTLGTCADAVAGVNHTLARALDVLADELQVAQERLSDVRRLARHLGLEVRDHVIRPPSAFWAPTSQPFYEAHLDRVELEDAYERCAALADRWQDQWTRARQAFESQLESNVATLVQATTSLLVAGYSAWLLRELGGVLAGQATHLWAEAVKYQDRATELTRQLRHGTVPAASRHIETVDAYTAEARRAEAAAEALTKPKLPLGLQAGLESLNVAATGYGVYADMQSGESGTQALVSQGGGWAAGFGAAWLASNVAPGIGPLATFAVVTTAGVMISIFTDNRIDKAFESRQESRQDGARHTAAEERIARMLGAPCRS